MQFLNIVMATALVFSTKSLFSSLQGIQTQPEVKITLSEVEDMVANYQKLHPKEFDYKKTKGEILRHWDHDCCSFTNALVYMRMDINALQALIEKYECENNQETAAALAKHMQIFKNTFALTYRSSFKP